MKKSLWFPKEEFDKRLEKLQSNMREKNIDLMIAYQPETVTYITGFFTTGYETSFSLAVIPVDGQPILITRVVEKFYFDQTGAYDSYEFYQDGEDVDEYTINAIKKTGYDSGHIGIDMGAWNFGLMRYQKLQKGLPKAKFIDVGDMANRMRWVKSPKEVDYMKLAAKAAESGMTAVSSVARAGVSERELAVVISSAQVRSGSDTAEVGPIASGERAFHIHGLYSDRLLESGDLVHIEMNTRVRHYFSRFMRPIKVGKPSVQESELAKRLISIQDKAMSEVAPGVHSSVPDRIYREGILSTGVVKNYPNKTFYSLGFMMAPTQYEPLEATPYSQWSFEEGMTFHTYMVVKGFCFSETIHVTKDGCERITTFPRELIIC